MQQSANPPARLNLEKATILLLDGDQMSMDILSQILSGFGAKNIQKFNAVEAAQRAVQKSEFDLVVVDPSMMGSEGYEFIIWLRRNAQSANRYTSVLIVTGQTQTSRIGAARDAGANFVVAKPLTPAVVLDRIMWMARDKRPHVDCKAYAGPDRRFKFEGPPPGSDGRREGDLSAAIGDASQPNLSQADIDAMMQPRKVTL
jgi:DNA-binding response OmpR family regulator